MKADDNKQWMIYGATGYTGELIAREAVERGLSPVLAGRSEEKTSKLAAELGLSYAVFSLDDVDAIAKYLEHQYVVLHCAGPFSATAQPMLEACIQSKTHYLDITGEIAVYELANSMTEQAKEAGVVLCPGVGFDVIPTDCVAAKLKEMLPDASHLVLGFDSSSSLSPGTAKTSVEGLPNGGKVRINGVIKPVALAYKTRKIDFGNGEKMAMTIPWGDVSTAYVTTQIPNIEVFIPAHPKLIGKLKKLNYVRFLLGLGFIQNFLKRQISKKIKGPSEEKRKSQFTYVWGEVKNAQGETKILKIKTANGYALTVTGSLAIVQHVFDHSIVPGYTTPSLLAGSDLITQLPGSGPWVVEE